MEELYDLIEEIEMHKQFLFIINHADERVYIDVIDNHGFTVDGGTYSISEAKTLLIRYRNNYE